MSSSVKVRKAYNESWTTDRIPAMIPFWIRIKRLPLHFWHDEMLRCIGKEIGSYEKHELTKTTARVRVLVNGLNPLIKETIIEYETREESRITLEYERLAIGFRPRSTWIRVFGFMNFNSIRIF